MAEAADKIEEVAREMAPVRRFELADLSKHGPWLMKRFAIAFPEVPERTVAGYLRGLLEQAEYMFLYQDHAVALAQLVNLPGFTVRRAVQERFVWVEDKTDKDQLENAADMYTHMKEFAKRREAVTMFVCENTDVPKNLIENRLGRLFDAKITHARVT
jgi:hypothetical protein